MMVIVVLMDGVSKQRVRGHNAFACQRRGAAAPKRELRVAIINYCA